MQGYVAERTTAWIEFEREWRRVTGGEQPAWPCAGHPLCAETLRGDGSGPPLRWYAPKALGILRVFPEGHGAGAVGLADVVASLLASGASLDRARGGEVEGAGRELTRLFAEGATFDELASMARSMGIDPCRLEIAVR